MQKISVPREATRQRKPDLAAIAQQFCEGAYVFAQLVLVKTSQPDVEEIAFAEAPSISLKITAEKKLRLLGGNVAGCCLRFVHGKLNFLRHHRAFQHASADKARNGAKVTSSSNQHPRAKLAIDNPAIRDMFDALDRNVFPHLGAAAPHQVFIKLAAADAVADRLIIVDRSLLLPHGAYAECGNRLNVRPLPYSPGSIARACNTK